MLEAEILMETSFEREHLVVVLGLQQLEISSAQIVATASEPAYLRFFLLRQMGLASKNWHAQLEECQRFDTINELKDV